MVPLEQMNKMGEMHLQILTHVTHALQEMQIPHSHVNYNLNLPCICTSCRYIYISDRQILTKLVRVIRNVECGMIMTFGGSDTA